MMGSENADGFVETNLNAPREEMENLVLGVNCDGAGGDGHLTKSDVRVRKSLVWNVNGVGENRDGQHPPTTTTTTKKLRRETLCTVRDGEFSDAASMESSSSSGNTKRDSGNLWWGSGNKL